MKKLFLGGLAVLALAPTTYYFLDKKDKTIINRKVEMAYHYTADKAYRATRSLFDLAGLEKASIEMQCRNYHWIAYSQMRSAEIDPEYARWLYAGEEE